MQFLRKLLIFKFHIGISRPNTRIKNNMKKINVHLFDGYKTGEGMDEELKNQFDFAEKATEALGLVTWPMVKFEADAAIAAAKYSGEKTVGKIFLCTAMGEESFFDKIKLNHFDSNT